MARPGPSTRARSAQSRTETALFSSTDSASSASRAHRLSGLGRQRWTDELLAVARADLHEPLPIEELLASRRQTPGPGGLAGIAEEPLHTTWPEEQQQSRLVGVDVERVRDTPRSVDHRAG